MARTAARSHSFGPWQAVVASGALVSGVIGVRLLVSIVCALRAVRSHPRPSLVLIAFAVAGIIGMIPITPGGLGIVEDGLSGFLVLAGVNSGAAVLATLTYRLASYWFPLMAGPIADAGFKHRYRHVAPK
jgi:uncharacterized protein (TIRG00374 family)